MSELSTEEAQFWFGSRMQIRRSIKKKLLEISGNTECLAELSDKDIKSIKEILPSMGSQLTAEEESELKKVREYEYIQEIKNMYEGIERMGMRYIFLLSREYPDKLKEIYDPPFGLFVKGKMPGNTGISLAIVGSRNCSSYGERMAFLMAERLSRCGFDIISGMARGIDGAAHRGAINAGKETYAVLGCGADICYPASNRKIYEHIAKEGGIISEYPPGTPPLAVNFPNRNRIISGMSDGVLVVEAEEKSGSLITAGYAVEQNRNVYAIPGRMGDRLSTGTNKLIQTGGAKLVLDAIDIMSEFEWKIRDILGKKDANVSFGEQIGKISLEDDEKIVYDYLSFSPMSLETLLSKTKMSVEHLSAILIKLELKEAVKEVAAFQYIRCGF